MIIIFRSQSEDIFGRQTPSDWYCFRSRVTQVEWSLNTGEYCLTNDCWHLLTLFTLLRSRSSNMISSCLTWVSAGDEKKCWSVWRGVTTALKQYQVTTLSAHLLHLYHCLKDSYLKDFLIIRNACKVLLIGWVVKVFLFTSSHHYNSKHLTLSCPCFLPDDLW